MVIFEEKRPLVITVYWQLGVWNSSLLKCPITSDLTCVPSNRPSNTVSPLTIPAAFCSRRGDLQRGSERKRWIVGERKEDLFKSRIKFSTINNISGFIDFFILFFKCGCGQWISKNLVVRSLKKKSGFSWILLDACEQLWISPLTTRRRCQLAKLYSMLSPKPREHSRAWFTNNSTLQSVTSG